MENASYNWPHVIKTVRAFVLENTKTDADTKAYLKLEMFETDTFHDYSSMDQLSEELDQGSEYGVWDALSMAVDVMGELITDHFSNAWNFGPGYEKPKKLVVPDVERISRAKWHKLLKDAAPNVFAEITQAAKDAKARAIAARKAKAAAISDKRVAELAKLYKDNLIAQCDKTVKGFKKQVHGDDVWYFEMTEAELKGFATGADFYAALQAKFTDPRKLFEKMLDVVTYAKAFTNKRAIDVWALQADRKGKNRLFAAVTAL
jgi:hypothetical protein